MILKNIKTKKIIKFLGVYMKRQRMRIKIKRLMKKLSKKLNKKTNKITNNKTKKFNKKNNKKQKKIFDIFKYICIKIYKKLK